MNEHERHSQPHSEAGFSLDKKVALITGGGRGIGVGIAEIFLEAGATVIINALTDVHLAKVVARLRLSHGDRVIGLVGDAASAAGAGDIVARATDHAGSIDILVNGVGDAIVGPLIEDARQELAMAAPRIQSIIDLNMMSAIHCTRAVGSGMIQRKSGRIINMTGVIGGLKGESGLSIYSAAKAGVAGFTRSLAREWAPYGITVNAIAPGVFPDMENLPPEHYQMIEATYLGRIPLGRFGRPREIGYLALYLAADASQYLSGQMLVLDGGLSA
jgi:NAD(P)-dependent dehydrogenase (short-subunit alcohol dehydrogenase family)